MEKRKTLEQELQERRLDRLALFTRHAAPAFIVRREMALLAQRGEKRCAASEKCD